MIKYENKILAAIGFIGFFVLIGSVGGIEQDTISHLQCMIQSIIGLLMMLLSAHFAGAMSYQDNKTSKETYNIRRYDSSEIQMDAEIKSKKLVNRQIIK